MEMSDEPLVSENVVPLTLNPTITNIKRANSDHYKECLFCLESNCEHDSDIENQQVVRTDESDDQSKNKSSAIQNFSDIFPCECQNIYAHGSCLQQWLSHEQACPVCKQAFSHSAPSQITTVTEVVQFSDTTQEHRKQCFSISKCFYCMVGCSILYYFLGLSVGFH